MKKTLKFWKWKLEVKTKRLDADEKIGYLANELVKELKASGRNIARPHIDKGFGGFQINIHSLGTNSEGLYVSDPINGWEVRAKPTFKEF